MVLSRRALVLAGSPMVLAAVAYPAMRAAAADPASPDGPWVEASTVGIASGNSGTANRAALVSALSNSSSFVYLPAGDYAVDNTGSDLVVTSFAGRLTLLPGARLVFADNTRRGIVFHGGTGAFLDGLTTTFATAPAARVNAQECILIEEAVDTRVEGVSVTGSAAAGLLFRNCVRPTVTGATIRGTMADGLHFANCQDGRADQVTTADTGDDGVAFVNYASGPANTGGLATSLSVTRSRSRGVSVVGQSGVTIRDAVVDTTVGHGTYCAYEAAWATRVPDDVRFERVHVTAGGAWTAAAGGGTNCGLRISGAGRVSAASVSIDAPGAHGVFVSTTTAATLTDVTVTGAPGNGFTLQGGSPVLDRLSATRTQGIGVTVSGTTRLDYGTLTLRDTALTHTTHRALNVENAGTVVGSRVWVIDDQATATGYVVGAYGTQTGTLGAIAAEVTSRALTVDDPSKLTYTRV